MRPVRPPWALDGILPPTESYTSPMDTNPGTSWSGISPVSTIDPRLLFTEQQRPRQNSARQPQSESPRTAEAKLRSPPAIRSPVVVNNNVPVGSADIFQCVGNNAEKINQSCLFCLSHLPSFATVVPTSISGLLTLHEGQKALKVVMYCFEHQPTRLNISERVLLEKPA